MPMLAELVDVVIGVDTHKHTHSGAVVTRHGTVLDEITIEATGRGFADLLAVAEHHPGRRAWAIEGTASYGAGLTTWLRERGERVIEVDRPSRPHRRHGRKSDELDAVRAARDAFSQEHLAQPRQGELRAALVTLVAARRSAVSAYTDAQRQLQDLVVTAPEALRARLRGLSTRRLITACERLRCPRVATVPHATLVAVLRSLAKRIRVLEAEARAHERAILAAVREWRSDLLGLFGVGPIVAAHVLCAWSHPERFRSEAAFAMLAGTAPIPASSGQVVRHRLNRFGDRQLNWAINTIVVQRLQRDSATRAYADRRRAEGKSPAEIRRCLKRYVARELFRLLEHHDTQALPSAA